MLWLETQEPSLLVSYHQISYSVKILNSQKRFEPTIVWIGDLYVGIELTDCSCACVKYSLTAKNKDENNCTTHRLVVIDRTAEAINKG